MQDITKALQDLAKAVESNPTVQSVKVTITLKKPTPSKAKPESKQLSQAESGRRAAPLVRPIISYIFRKFKRAARQEAYFMEITKGDTVYKVSENSKNWTVKKESDKLSVSFNVSKELCKTEQELREYVLSNSELF